MAATTPEKSWAAASNASAFQSRDEFGITAIERLFPIVEPPQVDRVGRGLQNGMELIWPLPALPAAPMVPGDKKKKEVVMVPYLLVLVGVASRYLMVSHVAWLNFTAVGGSLIYFGARRPWREMSAPLALFMLSDFCLTTYTYHYPFHWQDYGTTWAWYLMAMVLGRILLCAKTTIIRGAAAALLGPTSFFIVSNFSVWAGGFNAYPHTLAGLVTCYVAAIPFYRNDLISTSLFLGVVLGIEVSVRRMSPGRRQEALIGK